MKMYGSTKNVDDKATVDENNLVENKKTVNNESKTTLDNSVITENSTVTQSNNTQQSSSTTVQNNEETKNITLGKGEEIVNFAKQYLGYSYVYGGSSPNTGFDCSGFTMYIYKHFGISLPHSATAQSKLGQKIEKGNLQPGDIVYFSNYKTHEGIGHCGIYIGNGKFIHASTEKTGVIESSLNSGSYVERYVTANRFI